VPFPRTQQANLQAIVALSLFNAERQAAGLPFFRNFVHQSRTYRYYFNWTNVSPPQRGGAVPAPLSERWAEMVRQLPRGAIDNYHRLESFFRVTVHWPIAIGRRLFCSFTTDPNLLTTLHSSPYTPPSAC